MKLRSSSSVMSLIIIITMSLFIHTSQASSTPTDYLETLKRQNDARALVGVPHLEWNETIAAYARDWDEQKKADCSPIHSTGGYYGENLALGPWVLGWAVPFERCRKHVGRRETIL